MGRDVVAAALNNAEPEVTDCPARMAFGDETYRRRTKTPNTIGTLFGPIELQRCVYECLEKGAACIWPLELRLGIVAGRVESLRSNQLRGKMVLGPVSYA